MDYWSCSKFADFIRGTKKPFALEWSEWKEWEATARKAHPFRYWLAEDCLDVIQDILRSPYTLYRNISYYIRNRYISCTHALVADPKDIPRGSWCEYGDRILPCLFNGLKNYVEDDLAHLYELWNDYKGTEAGLANLRWQMSLVDEQTNIPTAQAVAAKEIYDLYIWWTVTRVARFDPMELYSLDNRDPKRDPFDFSDEDNKVFDQIRKIEEGYEKDDEEHLIRLIKIRGYLWT